MSGISGLLIIAIGLGAIGAMALLQYTVGRQRPKDLAGDHGAMHPNGSMVFAGVLIAIWLVCAGLFHHFIVAPSIIAVLIAMLGLLAAPILATGFSAIYDISWDINGVTGPTNMGFPPFGPDRRAIRFDDIIAAGRDGFGNYYVRSHDGTCIRWNWFYSGYPELQYFIEDVCPHLFPDLDMAEA